MPTVLSLENIGKKYTLRHQAGQQPYLALRDVIADSCKTFGRKIGSLFNQLRHDDDPAIFTDFWALRDVCFEVKQGERIGIIGRNGAGKSTLLKILSRIVEPTAGSARIKGRVASLLEVGTGFHPELTGRENIYLNGAILGMSRIDIKSKFDQIVDFAEIERFLDTPVKRYSSGMYVRLAFAVAAHLEPEILLVDEVLAVGDVQFQKKCLGKMENVAREGRTILFVSHQLEAIHKLCSSAVLLEDGTVAAYGATDAVIDRYLQTAVGQTTVSLRERRDRTGAGRLRFVSTWVEDGCGRKGIPVQSGAPLTIAAEYEAVGEERVSTLAVAFAVSDKNGFQLTDLSNATTGEILAEAARTGRISCTIPRLPLNAGRYYYNAIIRSGVGIEDFIIGAGSFDVEAGDYFSSGRTVDVNQGALLVDQKWGHEIDLNTDRRR